MRKSAIKQFFTGFLFIVCIVSRVSACHIAPPDPVFINTNGKSGLPVDSMIVFYEADSYFSGDHPLEVVAANGSKTRLNRVVPEFGFHVLNLNSFSFFKPSEALNSGMEYAFVRQGFNNNHERIKPFFGSSKSSRLSFTMQREQGGLSPITAGISYSVSFQGQGNCGMQERYVFHADEELSGSLYAIKIIEVSTNKSDYLLVILDQGNNIEIENIGPISEYHFKAGKQYKISFAPVSTTAQVGSFSSSITVIAPRPPFIELLKTDNYYWMKTVIAFSCAGLFAALLAFIIIYRKKRAFRNNEMR